MSSGMNVSGLASGIDTASIIQKLMSIESQPLTAMQSQQTRLQNQSNALSAIKSSIFALQQSVANLTLSSTFTGRTTTTSDSKVVTATAQNGAVNASYAVHVTSVATTATYVSSKLGTQVAGAPGWSVGTALVKQGSTAVANPLVTAAQGLNTQFTAGSADLGFFTINNARIDVTATDTVNTVLNKITASSAGVKATLDASNHVVLTQKNVGASPKITIANGSGNMLQDLGILQADNVTDNTTIVAGTGTDADENKALQDTALFGGATPMGSGYFSINGTYIYVDSTKDTLNTVISKINQSAAGVIASFDSTSKQITLTSKTVGAGDITFGSCPGTDSIDFVKRADLNPANAQPVAGVLPPISATLGGKLAGVDAVVTINGTSVTTKNGAATVNGINFTFSGVSSGADTVITVANDTDKTVNAVKDFVTQYNTINDQIQSALTTQPIKNATSDADKNVGLLFGDSLLRSLGDSLRSLLSQTISGGNPDYSQLSQIGLTTGAPGLSVGDAKKGTLVLDEQKLRQALSANSAAVADLLGKSNTVYAETSTVAAGGSSTVSLANKPISKSFTPQVTVDGVSYTLNNGTLSTKKNVNEFSVDYTTGILTFHRTDATGATIATPLNAGAKVSVNYAYDTTHSGIALQMKNLLAQTTTYGGSFDARIGSNGSIKNQIKDLNDQITSMQARLAIRQATLEKQFTAMETTLSKLKNQGNWFASQVGSSSSSSSSNG